MIDLVIENLGKVNTDNSKKLLSIYNDTQSEVQESYYASTVFNSQKEYLQRSSDVKGSVLATQDKSLVNTPLIFIKANEDVFFFSAEKQGIAFGATLVDYRTKRPLICFVVDKSNSGYSYTSTLYDEKTKQYSDSASVSSDCKSIAELATFVSSNVGSDIAKFVQSPVPKESKTENSPKQ